MRAHRFPIGTRYMSSGGKVPRECIVMDHLTTTNSLGNVVSLRYVCGHSFMSQLVLDHDVVDPTIAKGLLPEFQHLLKA